MKAVNKSLMGMVGTTMFVGCLVLAGCGLLAGPQIRDGNGFVTVSASISVSSLMIGDCIYDVSTLGSVVNSVQVVPCKDSHEGEVYAVAKNVENDKAALQEYCLGQFQQYVGIEYEVSVLDVTFIHNESTSPMTDLQCILFEQGKVVTTSYKGFEQ